MECVLCEAMDEAYRVVFRNEYVFVVVNLEPLKPGHLMVLPVRHIENLKDLDQNEAQEFLRAIDRCMETLTKMSDETPITFVHGWKHRTQPHLHAQIIPSKKSLRGLFASAEGIAERVRTTQDELTRMTAEVKKFY